MAAAAAEQQQQQYSPKIQKRTLKGHRRPILCLAHSTERLSHYHPDAAGGNAPLSDRPRPRPPRRRPPPSLLLSGSEDGTARLWDLRARRTALCMVIPRAEDDEDGVEVTSVAFHPSISEEIQTHDATTIDDVDGECKGNEGSLAFDRDCTVYASAGRRVYGYDLRHHAAALPASPIIKTPHLDLTPSFGCSDEINQLSFSFPRRNDENGKYWLAAADDSGEAHVADCPPHQYLDGQRPQSPNTATKGQHRTFHHAEPQTMAITSAAVFQPRTNNDSYLATGGTDCTVKLWDASKPRRPAASIHVAPAPSENTTQLCNPPYVHSLSWCPSGRLLAAGIGDGSCAIFRAEGRRLAEVGRLGFDEGGHGSAVAAVCFPSFGSSEGYRLSSKVRKSGEAEDRLLISAGNDGNILFWDLGRNMVGSGPLDPASYLGGCVSPPASTEKAKPAADDAGREDGKGATTDAMDSLHISNPKNGKKKGKSKKKGKGKKDSTKIDADCGDFPEDLIIPSPPKILFQIAHRHKPNWITCSRASDEVLPSSLFVADTTNNISVYMLPK